MKRFLFAIGLTLFLSGCATIFSGSRNTVLIRTDPPKANITIIDRHGTEVYNGSGQATIRLKTGAGYFVPARYTVKINATGYQERIVEIKSTINGWYFANIFIGGALGMLIIDPATGAMWRLKDIVIDEKLDKASPITGIRLQVMDIGKLSESEKNKLLSVK